MSLRLAASLAVAAALAAPALPAHAGNGVDLLRFMPEDSTVYMVVDVAGARDSALFKKGLDKLMAAAPGGFAAVQSAGLDPAQAIDTIAIAVVDVNAGNDFTIMAEGKQTQLIYDLIKKAPSVKAASYHGVTWLGDSDGAIAIIAKRLVFAKPDHIERAIDLALGKAKNAAKSAKAAALRAIIATTDTRQDVWAAVVMPPDVVAKAKAAGTELTGASIGATLSADLALDLKVLTASEAAATKLKTGIDQMVPMLTSELQKIGLTAAAKSLIVDKDGPTIHASITVTEAELKSLVAMMGGALGGMNFGGP